MGGGKERGAFLFLLMDRRLGLRKLVLAGAAERAGEVFGKVFPGGSRSDAGFRYAHGGIVFPSA
jgi:hypothetical protein